MAFEAPLDGGNEPFGAQAFEVTVNAPRTPESDRRASRATCAYAPNRRALRALALAVSSSRSFGLVCWHERGFLMTAAHVVTGRTPIREEDWKDPELSVLGRTSRGEYVRYEVAMCGVSMDFSGPLKGPLQVDLARLRRP
jgi:hypothetical protein